MMRFFKYYLRDVVTGKVVEEDFWIDGPAYAIGEGLDIGDVLFGADGAAWEGEFYGPDEWDGVDWIELDSKKRPLGVLR